MKKQPVVFIAFRDYDNLGIGYLASVLSKAGFKTVTINFRSRKETILKRILNLNPLLIGFSIIFQYHIIEFKDLINYLRKGGIRCHFTAGGQYASLRYEELINLIPQLDSIVRFEGEHTLLELVNCIFSEKDWKDIAGIVYKINSKIFISPARPLEKDIDKFPFPLRSPLTNYALGKKFASIIAGRGCVHDCSFCNNKEYSIQSPGPAKRIRKPEKIVEEIEVLYYKKECSVFLFQDDDFPVKTGKGYEWVIKFCKELERKGLSDKIMWKINCRSDEIDEKIFNMMKLHGLYLVFLGIDDGTDAGLKWLNKHITVAKNLEGINILKKLGIGLDYGFMLFQPITTYRSLNDNLDFLKLICGDSYSAVTFLKLLPYYDTWVEKELRKEGRIKGPIEYLNYDFLEESMNHFYNFITACFKDWMENSDGLVNISKWARDYFAVFSHYFNPAPELPLLKRKLRKTISKSNLFFLNTMKELSCFFESGRYKTEEKKILVSYKENIDSKHQYYKKRINNIMENLLILTQPLPYFYL
ncbi:MAG: cobalamin-dependent protein [Bacteroidia bacterium]|nr:cobalamin-dependent protein [Bacteroidia bacterium]